MSFYAFVSSMPQLSQSRKGRASNPATSAAPQEPSALPKAVVEAQPQRHICLPPRYRDLYPVQLPYAFTPDNRGGEQLSSIASAAVNPAS
jgi:hypothetical protein